MDDKTQTYLDEFKHYLQIDRMLKPGSVRTYNRALEFFFTHTEKPPAEITPDDINHYIFNLKAEGRAHNLQRQRQTIVRMFFNWYSQVKYPGAPNPGASIKIIHEEQKIPRVLSPEEIIRMIAQCDVSDFQGRRDAALMALLADTGIRRSECAALRVGDVVPHKTHFVLNVPRIKSYERAIPFCNLKETSFISEYFTQYWQEITVVKRWGRNHPLFMTMGIETSGTKLGGAGIRFQVKKYARDAGVHDVSPHSFRHFYATYSYLNGVDVMTIRKLMGHALLETTMKYIHIASVVDGSVLKKTATANMVAPKHMTGYVKIFKDSQR